MLRQPPTYTGNNVGMVELRDRHGIMPSRAKRPFAVPISPSSISKGRPRRTQMTTRDTKARHSNPPRVHSWSFVFFVVSDFVFSDFRGFVTRATIAILTMLMAGGAGAQQTLCPGDCAVDGEVQVTDVVIMINVINGSRPIEDCRAGDFDDDARIRANDVTRAVRSILDAVRRAPSGRRRSTAR
jgi:hypothetical protein